MREIKFRAWDKDEEWMVCNVQDAYDGLPYSKENAEHIVDSYDWVSGFSSFLDSDDFIPMQYTGLIDKNGVEIYEGDILSGEFYFRGVGWYDTGEGNFSINDPVIFEAGKFICRGFDLCDINDEMKVIGNIYDSPEPMEVEE